MATCTIWLFNLYLIHSTVAYQIKPVYIIRGKIDNVSNSEITNSILTERQYL